MPHFQTQKPNLGKFLRASDWKLLIYCIAVWDILRTFGIFYDTGYILSSFVIFFRFWYDVPRKIWQPWLECQLLKFINVPNVMTKVIKKDIITFARRESADIGRELKVAADSNSYASTPPWHGLEAWKGHREAGSIKLVTF
jgi:hypothetical protein